MSKQRIVLAALVRAYPNAVSTDTLMKLSEISTRGAVSIKIQELRDKISAHESIVGFRGKSPVDGGYALCNGAFDELRIANFKPAVTGIKHIHYGGERSGDIFREGMFEINDNAVGEIMPFPSKNISDILHGIEKSRTK
jgi:hypothetical protein